MLRSEQTITPEVSVRWNLDAEGNLVGLATFSNKTDRLIISSHLLLQQKVTNPFDFLLDGRALNLPIFYDSRETALLSPFLKRHGTASSAEVAALIRPFLNGISAKSSTLDFLTTFNRAIPALFRYSERHEAGGQSAKETIAKREGTCRDFAYLFTESVRSVGIAARYISGYLCSSPGAPGENHTHGWCEVYLTGAGWRGFDPTSGILAGPQPCGRSKLRLGVGYSTGGGILLRRTGALHRPRCDNFCPRTSSGRGAFGNPSQLGTVAEATQGGSRLTQLDLGCLHLLLFFALWSY